MRRKKKKKTTQPTSTKWIKILWSIIFGLVTFFGIIFAIINDSFDIRSKIFSPSLEEQARISLALEEKKSGIEKQIEEVNKVAFIKDKLLQNSGPGTNGSLLTEVFGPPALISNFNASMIYNQWSVGSFTIGAVLENSTNKIEILALANSECNDTIWIDRIQASLCESKLNKDIQNTSWYLLSSNRLGGYFEELPHGGWTGFEKDFTASNGKANEGNFFDYTFLDRRFWDKVPEATKDINPVPLHEMDKEFLELREKQSFNYYAHGSYNTTVHDIEKIYMYMERPEIANFIETTRNSNKEAKATLE